MIETVKTYAANLTVNELAVEEDLPFVDTETGEILEPLNK